MEIRERLSTIFDDPGLEAFCQDYFPEVSDKFGRGQRKDEKITMLLDHVRRQDSIEVLSLLLDHVQRHRSKRDVVLDSPSKRRWVWILGAILVLMLVVGSGGIGYWLCWDQGSAIVIQPHAYPRNVSQHFDFEQGVGERVTLGVCDTIPPPWHDNCHDDLEKLFWAQGGFTSKHSLGCRVKLLPEKEQVYSVRFLLDTPEVIDAVSANVYVPDAKRISYISIGALLQEDWEWKISGLYIDKEGWLRLFLDLQQFSTESGEPANGSIITEVHVDVFIPKAFQQLEETIKIDDIELYYPSSKVLLSTPTPSP